MTEPTHELVLARYFYDPSSGKLTHRTRNSNRVQIGDEVGNLHVSGYLTTTINGKAYKLHRLIWFYMTGCWPTQDIDHINGNRSHNAWSNLRECSREENLHNMQPKNPRSGLKGVLQRGRSFMVRVRTKGKVHYIGSFRSAKEAAAAYDEAVLHLHKNFARTNASLGLI